MVVVGDLDDNDESDIEIGALSDEEGNSDNDQGLDLPGTSGDSDRHNTDQRRDLLTNVTERVKPFTEISGPIHDLPEDSQPIDYFKPFLII